MGTKEVWSELKWEVRISKREAIKSGAPVKVFRITPSIDA